MKGKRIVLSLAVVLVSAMAGFTGVKADEVESTEQATVVQQLVLVKPTIDKAVLVTDKLIASTDGVDVEHTRKLEWKVVNTKTKKEINDVSYSTVCQMTGVSRGVYTVQVRAVGVDENYNDIYSEWSDAVYVVSQPKIYTTKNKYIKRNSTTVHFKKMKGVKNYTIYMRKHKSKKWTKLKTTTKNKVKFTKFKGKKIDNYKNSYDFCVVANVKVGKKTVKSGNYEYFKTRFYIY